MRVSPPKPSADMLAIDTNVVVRYLIGDHPEQAARARALIDNQEIFLSITVLLETEWVLRSVYGLDRTLLAKGLRRLGGLAYLEIEDSTVVAQALDWMENGMDFADALHLAKATHCDAFVTFDRDIARAAKRIGITGVRAPE
jgi:predicted nucleic acid-binding protein